MARVDPDQPDPRLIRELVARYEASARRLRDQVLHPPGKSDSAREWNQARAAQILSQVEKEIARLKKEASDWTGKAITQSMRRGIAVADRQASQAGITPPGSPVQGSFGLVDRDAVKVLARDTVGDLFKAADSMQDQAAAALRRMAATGVTNAEVNSILTGGIIEGKPQQAIRELREALKKVHGRKVTIRDKNGDPMTFDVGYYARMVATTKTREATTKARHARLAQQGIDLVVVQGRVSVNFCTAYLNKVFSISGKHPRYPALSSLPGGGPPFHPNCTKSTSPFIEELADPEEIEAGQPDPDLEPLLNVRDRSELQRRFQATQGRQLAEARRRRAQGRPDAGRRAITSARDDVQYQTHLIREMGVEKVDLGRHPEIGAQLVQGLQRVISAGGPLPRSVVVDAATFEKRPDVAAFIDTETRQMMINPNVELWRDGGALIRKMHKTEWIASDNPLHVIYHEAAHLHAVDRGADHHKEAFLDPQERAIARSVSRCAALNKDEFLAEVRAARMAGRRFGQDMLGLYEKQCSRPVARGGGSGSCMRSG